MPRSKELSEAMRAAAKEKILAAALTLFSEKGISATGVKEIAALAGVSSGLLYHYFKTKDEIFVALVKQAQKGQEAVGAFLMEGNPAVKIKDYLGTVLDDIAEDGESSRMMNLFTSAFIENIDFPGRDEILEGSQNFENQLRDLIARGQAEGVFKEGNPVAMAQLLIVIVNALCGMKLGYKDKSVLPTVEMLTAFILKEEYN